MTLSTSSPELPSPATEVRSMIPSSVSGFSSIPESTKQTAPSSSDFGA